MFTELTKCKHMFGERSYYLRSVTVLSSDAVGRGNELQFLLHLFLEVCTQQVVPCECEASILITELCLSRPFCISVAQKYRPDWVPKLSGRYRGDTASSVGSWYPDLTANGP